MMTWKQPKTQFENIWMGWSYGEMNALGQTLAARVANLEVGFEDLSFAHQVHGKTVLKAVHSGELGKADALWTDSKKRGLVIQTADCVPIFLIGDGVIAVVHAGWRGIANQILAETCSLNDFHTAIIGPCISGDNYEVGEEVVTAIVAAGIAEEHFVDRSFPKPHVDARRAVLQQLLQLGLEKVEIHPACTFDDTNWASYRRDGKKAGRILSVIGMI
jgi:YfiH family protein